VPDIEDLTSKGEIIVTEGNRPFITTDADSIWIVKEGRVNFYCVDNEGEPGRRYYLCTMEKNDFFIGGISYEKYGFYVRRAGYRNFKTRAGRSGR
jgi:hypothetical protein